VGWLESKRQLEFGRLDSILLDMDSLAESPPTAWLPLTPSGVAAFARASFSRLWLVQIVSALLVAGTVGWVLNTCWFPVVSAAVEHLPQTGAIRAGHLDCGGDPVQRLAESRLIAFAIDLQHAGQARSPSQLQFEFGQADLRIYSVFGLAEVPYPVSLAVPFNYQQLKPWWGAWAPNLMAMAVLGTVLALLLSWAILATVYCLVVWLLGLYLNRDLTLRGSWLTAGAALMPGALVMAGAIACYGMGKLDLIRLLAGWCFHLVLGWAYLILGATAAPKIAPVMAIRENPFKNPAAIETKEPPPNVEKSESKIFRPSGD
jgi:hypothetical protein